MDARTFAGKTVFFVLICLFVSLFSSLFGQENSQVGVVVVILALVLLERDLSVKPARSLGMLLSSTVMMGLFAFVSVQYGNPLIGAVLNFAYVFSICFVTMRGPGSPMHFPFLLGYTLMLTIPVDLNGLAWRIAAFAIGSVTIVALNIVFNRNNRKKERQGIVEVCDEVASCCESAMAGTNVSPVKLSRLCTEVNRRLYNHLEDRFYSSPNDRALLDLVVSLQVMGTAVCDRERDINVLTSLRSIVGEVAENQKETADTDLVLSSIDSFLLGFPDADPEILSSLRTMRDELWRIDYRTTGYTREKHDVTRSFVIGSIIRETLRTDSARFTFSFRMALIFTLCALVWQLSGEDDARALLFATIAMVQPYVEGTRERTLMRLAGTFAGIGAVIAVLYVSGGDAAISTTTLLIANYLLTLLDPKRFDVMIAFITFSSLLTASLSYPAGEVLTERVAFILLGVLIAYIANRTVLPYHIRDENIELAERYIGITGDQIGNIGKAARGESDTQESVALALTAATVSAKLSMNLGKEGDHLMERFLAGQDSLTARCRLATRSLGTVGSDCRRMVSAIVSGEETGTGTEGLEAKEMDLVREVRGMMDSYRRDTMVLEHIRKTPAQRRGYC